MLARENRLRKAKDFQAAVRGGKSVGANGLVLRVGKLEGISPRLGIVVSKKVSKQAVQRNRIRRILREAARKEMQQMKGGMDLVLIVRPGIAIEGAREAQEILHKLFQKASLLKQ